TDEEENEAGTDPKDPNEFPATPINPAPTVDAIDNQTVNEDNAITPIVVNAEDDGEVTVEVSELPEGVSFNPDTNEISGTPVVDDWGATEEERSFEIVITATDKDGNTTTETVIITVQRDTDGDGDPDVTDPDDDNDGFTDEEEIDAGTDPKDPNSYPEDKSDNVDDNDGDNVQPTPPTNVDDSDDGVVDVPVIHPVDVDDHQVTGTGTPGHSITVTLPNGETVTTTVDSDGTWTVTIPASVRLEVGKVITAVATDEDGNVSAISQVTVTDKDQTAAAT